MVAPMPEAARGTPFGARIHAVATYLKTFRRSPTSDYKRRRCFYNRQAAFAAAEMSVDRVGDEPF